MKYLNFLLKYWKELGISAIIVSVIGLITAQQNNKSAQAISQQNNKSDQEIVRQGIDGIAEIERQKAEETRLKEVREKFSKAMENINSNDNQVRQSAIRGIGITWNDILKKTPEKQWEIVEALASSITTYPKFSGKSDIRNKQQSIQMALNILKSRNPEDDNNGKMGREGSRIIGLAKTNLQNYDFSNGQFPNASFDKSNLENATLTGANLKGSYFIGSSLKGAGMKNVDLSEAHVKGTDLSGADLSNANLADSNLWKTDFRGANLKNVNLTGSNITDKQIMQSCNWRSAIENNGRIEDLKQKHIYKKKPGCAIFE
jgi:uncharacterized protein YjbI with pentapeptide repeats